jgi:hypothetical protein
MRVTNLFGHPHFCLISASTKLKNKYDSPILFQTHKTEYQVFTSATARLYRVGSIETDKE